MTLSVLHVVVAGEVGGAERFVADLAAPGRADGVEHVVALLASSPSLAAFFRGSGARVVDLGPVTESIGAFLVRTFGARYVTRVADVARDTCARIAHLHTFGSHVIGARAAERAGIPFVRTEHSTRVYSDPSCWPFSRWSLRRSRAVVAVSDYVRRVALAREPTLGRKISVVRNGILFDRFAARPMRGGKGEPVAFVIVARLERRKGVDLALTALAGLRGARLSIVGDGDDRQRLEAHARKLGLDGRVTFHGYQPDPRPFMAAADVGLCTSRDEGLGIGLLEMMACALPVVAVPVGGVPEIVRTGETGLLSSERSGPALRAVMQAIVDDGDLRRRLGEQARAYVARHHTLETVRESYGRVYRDALASR